MCHPRWDSDAVFSSLVGGPGVYSVTPDDAVYVWGGSYETGSLIWRSRWVTTAGVVVAADGAHPVLDDAVAFVSQRLLDDGPDLSPAYDVEGGSIPRQRKLDLPGYPGGEVRIGNWVRRQFQLDAFGEALLLLAAGAGHDRLDVPEWRAVEAAVSAIEQRWGDQGAGI